MLYRLQQSCRMMRRRFWHVADRVNLVASPFLAAAAVIIAIVAVLSQFFSVRQTTTAIVLTSPMSGERVAGELRLDGTFQTGPYAASKLLVCVTVTDANGAAHEVQIGVSDLPILLDTAGFADGVCTVHVTMTLGGEQVAEVRRSLLLDNTGPEIRLAQPVQGEAMSGIVQVAAAARDPAGIAETSVRLGGVEFPAIAVDTTRVPDGIQTLEIRSSDLLGNTSSLLVDIVVDNAAPRILSLGPAEDLPLAGNALITPALEERALAQLSYRIDGGDRVPVKGCTIPIDTRLYTNGLHELAILARDMGGRTCETIATVTIDNELPFLSAGTAAPTSAKSEEDSPSRADRTVFVDGIPHQTLTSVWFANKEPRSRVIVLVRDSWPDGTCATLELDVAVPESIWSKLSATQLGRKTTEFLYTALTIARHFLYLMHPVVGGLGGLPVAAILPLQAIDGVSSPGVIRVGASMPFMEYGGLSWGKLHGAYFRLSASQIDFLVHHPLTGTLRPAEVDDTSGDLFAIECGSVAGEYWSERSTTSGEDGSMLATYHSKRASQDWVAVTAAFGGDIGTVRVAEEYGFALACSHDEERLEETFYPPDRSGRFGMGGVTTRTLQRDVTVSWGLSLVMGIHLEFTP